MDNTLLFFVASIIGSVAFTISGFLVGVRRELDAVGIFIVSMLTANGGGAIRDILVGNTPASVLTNIESFLLVLMVLIAAAIFRLHKYNGLEQKMFFVVSDAIGLSAFAVTGAMVGIENDLHIFGVMTIALLTATGGGIIRDVLMNQVPSVLYSGFYGSVAMIIGATLFILNYFHYMNNITIIILFFFGLTLRIVAYLKDWNWFVIKNNT